MRLVQLSFCRARVTSPRSLLLITFGLFLQLFVGCDRQVPTTGLLPLQMTESEHPLVAAEVHFFNEKLNLEPLQQELRRVDDYLAKKRYRYAQYEPELVNDVADDFIQLSAQFSVPSPDPAVALFSAPEPDAIDEVRVERLEFMALKKRLSGYIQMVAVHEKALQQLKQKQEQHLEVIAKLEQESQSNFNQYLVSQSSSMPAYRFTTTPFQYKKHHKQYEYECEPERYDDYRLLDERAAPDPIYCWYLKLPHPIFHHTQAETEHITLFGRYYPHHQVVSVMDKGSLQSQILAAQQAYNVIEKKAQSRFNVATSDIKRFSYLRQLFAAEKKSADKPEHQYYKLKRLRETAEHYKAALTLYYLFINSFSSTMVSSEGRFDMPSQALFMLVYGLYGPDVQQAKEYFWFVDLQRPNTGTEHFEIMSLPEKPSDESLVKQLKLTESL